MKNITDDAFKANTLESQFILNASLLNILFNFISFTESPRRRVALLNKKDKRCKENNRPSCYYPAAGNLTFFLFNLFTKYSAQFSKPEGECKLDEEGFLFSTKTDFSECYLNVNTDTIKTYLDDLKELGFIDYKSKVGGHGFYFKVNSDYVQQVCDEYESTMSERIENHIKEVQEAHAKSASRDCEERFNKVAKDVEEVESQNLEGNALEDALVEVDKKYFNGNDPEYARFYYILRKATEGTDIVIDFETYNYIRKSIKNGEGHSLTTVFKSQFNRYRELGKLDAKEVVAFIISVKNFIPSSPRVNTTEGKKGQIIPNKERFMRAFNYAYNKRFNLNKAV